MSATTKEVTLSPGGTNLPLVIGLLLVNGIALSATLMLSKTAQNVGVSPFAFGFWMCAGGGLILSAFALGKGRVKITREFVRYCIIAGLISMAVPQMIIFVVVGEIGPGLAGVAYAMPTLLTWLLSRIWGLDAASSVRFIGAVLGLSGAFYMLLPAGGAVTSDQLPWMALSFLAPISIAAGNIYRGVAWPRNARPLDLAAGMLMASAVMFLTMALALDSELAVWNYKGGTWPVLAQALLAALQFLAYFALQKYAAPVVFSLIGQVTLCFSMLAGALLFGESYSTGIYIAVAFMFAGFVFVILGAPKTKPLAPKR